MVLQIAEALVDCRAAEARFSTDREKIASSRALRRLAGKTQVVAMPGDPLIRTRLTHTLEVCSIARQIAVPLGMRVALVEAIALGHDLGHPAFGHAGERALAALVPGGFHHAAHGVRVVTELERLDLSHVVVIGILTHSKGKGGTILVRGGALAGTHEARVVRAADLFAYASHDLDDAYLLEWLRPSDVPSTVRRVLGDTPGAVLSALMERTVHASLERGELALDDEATEALGLLRAFLYERLYESPRIVRQTGHVRALFESLWEAVSTDPAGFERLAAATNGLSGRFQVAASVTISELFVDTVAAMTDRQLLRLARELAIPRPARAWPACVPHARS